MAMVEKLIQRSFSFQYRQMRSTHERARQPQSSKKRKRMSTKNLCLPVERLQGSKEVHVLTATKKRSSCKYCSFLQIQHRLQGKPGPPPAVSSVYRKCSSCDVHLCSAHFDAYHAHEQPEESENSNDEIGNDAAKFDNRV